MMRDDRDEDDGEGLLGVALPVTMRATPSTTATNHHRQPSPANVGSPFSAAAGDDKSNARFNNTSPNPTNKGTQSPSYSQNRKTWRPGNGEWIMAVISELEPSLGASNPLPLV